MRKWIFGFIILISLGILFYKPEEKVLAQARFDLACPVGGSQPFSPLLTINPQTGNFKANACIDSTGALIFQGGVSFPLLAPNGTIAAPSYAFSNFTGDGLSSNGTSIFLSQNGVSPFNCQENGGNVCRFPIGGEGVEIGSGGGGSGIILSRSTTSGLLLAPDTGAAAGSGGITSNGILFTNLPAATNGTMIYCSDCTVATAPCTGASTGAMAFRVNGAWRCQ